jgi:NADH dehydrogenase
LAEPNNNQQGLHRIVVVGGGAGGLELVTRLGHKLGRRGKAHVTLIEKARTHFWKPHLHEIAAGSMDINSHAIDYLAQSHWHGFRYRLGAMVGLDRERREVQVAPVLDEEGSPITPPYVRGYDTLVIATGSHTNDYGTPGVLEYAIALETPEEADRFHRRMVNACIRAHVQGAAQGSNQVTVAIVGAGATGVELAAELRKALRLLVTYGLDQIDPERDIQIHLIEAGPRILAALPQRIADAAGDLLNGLSVQVRCGTPVSAVRADGVELRDGTFVHAQLVVWAAGVKAPAWMKDLAGLETNALNQLVVRPTLQTTRDDAVFAIGDCAAAPWLGHQGAVPPRAQAAHQQASHLAKQLPRHLRGLPLKTWRYRDFGSLVSLGEHTTVGNLMGGLVGGNLWVEGLFARMMYLSLYKLHELAVHGWWRTAMSTASRMLQRRSEPRVKLH